MRDVKMDNKKKDFVVDKLKNNREGDGVENKKNKKPFDKKTYRLKKYSNKYKVEQWEERRKKSVIRRFYKDIRQEQKPADKKLDNSLIQGSSQEQDNKECGSVTSKRDAYHAAEKMFKKKKDEKKERREAAVIKQKEKAEALRKYKAEKASKYKKLCKKTRKGQPVMKDRLEMLLEKIQETT